MVNFLFLSHLIYDTLSIHNVSEIHVKFRPLASETFTDRKKLNRKLNRKCVVIQILCIYLIISEPMLVVVCGYLKQDLILPDGKNISEISVWCIVIHSIIAPNNVQ